MTFTDDDLKRLKALPLGEVSLFLLQEGKLGALLARLEAAERAVFSLETVTRWMREERYKKLSAPDLVWLEGAEIGLEAWRKAAGKDKS
jgi:hypothetical protein